MLLFLFFILCSQLLLFFSDLCSFLTLCCYFSFLSLSTFSITIIVNPLLYCLFIQSCYSSNLSFVHSKLLFFFFVLCTFSPIVVATHLLFYFFKITNNYCSPFLSSCPSPIVVVFFLFFVSNVATPFDTCSSSI